MARYLIFFQYIGTKYSGAVKVPATQLNKKGVQNHLEEAIQALKPQSPVSLTISSRTDSGVHALSNSAHFDLRRKNDKEPFSEDCLVQALNFNLGSQDIKITRAKRVPEDFHARYSAQSRTYVYRLAHGASHHFLLPLTERDFCWHLGDTKFDFGAMHEASALLVGKRDFSTFRAINPDIHFKNTVKTLYVISIQPGRSFTQAHFHRELQFWDLTFIGRSFNYKQVRRMTGALVAVGRGRLSVPQLKEILEARESTAYPQGLSAPARGLFLTRVDYRDTDVQFPPDPSVSIKTSEEETC